MQARLRRIETAQNSCIPELEELPARPAATAALRGRIRVRFAQFHDKRQQLDAQLASLATTTPKGRRPGAPR